jgi:hypothetical protein
MENYHGIIVDKSQKDKDIFNWLKIIGSKTTSKGWILYKIEINPEEIEKVIKELQQNMEPEPFYCHFYRDNELIVVFKEKVFRIMPDKSTWKEAIEYGKSLGIPEKQLDFSPCKIEEETY